MSEKMNSESVAGMVEKTVLSPKKIQARVGKSLEEKTLGRKIEGARMAKGIFGQYAEDLFGRAEGTAPESLQGQSWDELDEDTQKEELFDVFSLGAEQKDLLETIKRFGNEAEKAPTFEIKVLNGRRIRVPVASEGEGGASYRTEAAAHAEQRLNEVKQELANLGAIPGFKEAYINRLTKYFFLMKASAEARRLRDRNAEIDAQIQHVREDARQGTAGVVRGAERKQIALLETEREANEQKIASLKESEGGSELTRLEQLREYADAAAANRMVEIPSVKETVEDGLENMRNHQPFLLAGHLGSGKTEAAKHMARLFMMENGVGFDSKKSTDDWYNSLEPEIFSGSEGASVYDLVGKLKLVGKSADDPKELTKRVGELSAVLETAGVENVPKDEIAKILLGKGDVTETVFNYGPFGRALKRGVPVIIDEVNRIPPEVTSRINDVMLRGIGSKVHLQENGEEEFAVQPGFAVLGTCNLGAQYAGLQDVDAAFKSRWVAKEVFYPDVGETYDLMLAALLRKDRPRLPPDFPADGLDQMVDLAVAAREIQEIFAGRTEGQRFMAMATGASAEKSQLDKAVVSTRDIMRKIIKPWRESGFKTSLDEIIAKNILAAEVFSVDDQKFMTEIFIRRGFFQGWNEKQFTKTGIQNIGQQELDALQAAALTDDYKTANAVTDQLRAGAHEHASLARAELLIGTDAGKKK